MTTFASTFLHQRDLLLDDARALLEAIGDPQDIWAADEVDDFVSLLLVAWPYFGLRHEILGAPDDPEALYGDVSWGEALVKSERELDDQLRRLVPAPRMDVVPDPWPQIGQVA